ncbi:SIS domain-containing protein [Cupriavidus sp. 2KB_3]|uniref:KpsF/GutQ family sugar-phosphate isomerase n=1 Tax=Cupriavidus sp. 2KB_3 TaxID=3232980 RepID=UPI003F91CB2C
MQHLDIARDALRAQSEAVALLADRIGQEFEQAVDMILKCTGRVVICGMGKSGLIAKKLAATFASTGTPSFFLHPGEAFHGDLGMLKPVDMVILISYSGETEEVVKLLPSLKDFGNPIIAMCGGGQSTMAKAADVWLDVSVPREVCPNNLAPTTSTLATMAMGDALAVALIKARDFKPLDFARFHPGGSLGRKLLTRVRDVMRSELPVVSPEASFHDCLFAMTKGRAGVAVVMEADQLLGIVTDGDLRRALMNATDMQALSVRTIMTAHPLTIDADAQLAAADVFMREKKVRILIVTEGTGKKVCGLLEIFD